MVAAAPREEAEDHHLEVAESVAEIMTKLDKN